MKEREKLTREQAIEFCESRKLLHEKARDHIKANSDLRKDRVSKIKYDSRVKLANTYADIAELLKG